MDRFAVWTVLLVILAVYTSARNSYENPSDADIDQEINNIARAIDDAIDDQDERDFGAYCDSVCSGRDICDCLDPDCDPDECPITREVGDGDNDAEEGLSKTKGASGAVQTKFLRFRLLGRRRNRLFFRRLIRRIRG